MSTANPKAIAYYPDALPVLLAIEEYLRDERSDPIGQPELTERFLLWSHEVHNSYEQVHGTPAEHGAIIDVISLHLSHRALDIERFKATNPNDEFLANQGRKYRASVRDWVALTATLCPTYGITGDHPLGVRAEEFLKANGDAINEAYPGIRGIDAFIQDAKNSFLLSHVGVLLARELDREILKMRKANIGAEEKPWLYPPQVFAQIGDEVFASPAVCRAFLGEVKQLPSRCGDNGLKDFRDFLYGARRYGLTETFHDLANRYPVFNELMGSVATSLGESIEVQSQDTAVARFVSMVEEKFPGRAETQKFALSKVLTRLYGSSIDPDMFATYLGNRSTSYYGDVVHPLASRWRTKDFLKGWNKFRESYDPDYDANDHSMSEFVEALRAEFPDKDDLTAAIGLIEEVYSPIAGATDRNRFDSFLLAASDALVQSRSPFLDTTR